MAYFPLYIDIEEKKCIVIGGGKIAAGKIGQLLEFGASVTVVAPEVTEEIRNLEKTGQIVWEQRAVLEESEAPVLGQRAIPEESETPVLGQRAVPEESEAPVLGQRAVPEESESPVLGQRAAKTEREIRGQETGSKMDTGVCALIENSTLVVAATDQPEVNRSISRLCKEKHIPVNVVDEKELCTFFFPAIVKREDVVVAVSTGGTSPALAARLRRELEEAVPEKYARAASVMGNYREYVKERVPDIRDRKRVFEALLSYAVEEAEVRREDVDRILFRETRDSICRSAQELL